MTDPIISGEPGTRWRNDSGLVLFQLVCSFSNSCGYCINLHHAIAPYFNLPFHRRCRCVAEILIPGALALPWVDYRKVFGKLSAQKRRTAVGKSVAILIEKGIVTLEEAVTTGRPKSLEEIAQQKGLSADDLIRAGIDPEIARRAAIHPPITPEAAEAAHYEQMRQRISGAAVVPAVVPVKTSPSKPSTEAAKPPGELLKAGNETLARIMAEAGVEPIAIPDFGGDVRSFRDWMTAILPPDALARVSDLDWIVMFAAVEAYEQLKKMFRRVGADHVKAMKATLEPKP